MTDFIDADPVEDARLLAAARGGDTDALGQLWHRHATAARRYAARLTTPSDVDDLVSEGFYRVLRAVTNGGGPESAFRTYLFTTLRRAHLDHVQGYRQRVRLTGESAELEREPTPSAAEVVGGRAEQLATWTALASLPDEQRTLLWRLIVEESTPAELAPAFQTTPNGVASRALRARERLRQAFLQASIRSADAASCRPTRDRLGQYVRNGVSARDRRNIEVHLGGCLACRAALDEASSLNQTIRGSAVPILLGAALVLLRQQLGAALRPGRLLATSVRIKGATVAGATVSAVLVVTLPMQHGHLGGGRPADRDALGPTLGPTARAVTSVTPSRVLNQPSLAAPTTVASRPVRSSTTPAPSGTFVLAPARPAGPGPARPATSAPGSPTPTGSAGSTGPTDPAGSADPAGGVSSAAASQNSTGPTASPSASPSTGPSNDPQLQTQVVRTIRYTLVTSGPTAIPGQLTARTGSWQIQSLTVTGPAGACTIDSATSAHCRLTDASEASPTFEITVGGPGSPDTLELDYQGDDGSHTEQSVPLN